MPQVIFSTTALRDLERLREFLRPKNSVAAKRTALVIIKAVQVLAQYPQIGKCWIRNIGSCQLVLAMVAISLCTTTMGKLLSSLLCATKENQVFRFSTYALLGIP